MKLSTLQDWLSYLQAKQVIKLGLDRVQRVLSNLTIQFICPIITVAGTNGKGSTVKVLEAIYHRAGFNVASFTSPMLLTFNEQIRINEIPLDDASIMRAFEVISESEGADELTPFEFQTVTALYLFSQRPIDVMILEVGLGGRLDAVNAIDADVAVITSISLDHTEYLGKTREAIGYEKAGIMRQGRPAVIGEIDIPDSVIRKASEVGAILYRQGIEFSYARDDVTWHWQSALCSLSDLPIPSLFLQNVSSALMTVTLLNDSLPVSDQVVRDALKNVTLDGRIQVMAGDVTRIFDVSHNPASVALLAQYLREHPISGKTYAVFSMLSDKDIAASIDVVRAEIDEWWVAELEDKRAMSVHDLSDALGLAGVMFYCAESIKSAYDTAWQRATIGDRVVIFGSFHTVAEVLPASRMKQ